MTLDAFDFFKNLSNNLQNQKKNLLKEHKTNTQNYGSEISQIEAEVAVIANALPFYEVIDPSINYGSDCVRFGAIVILKISFELLKIKIVGSVEFKFEHELKKALPESWDILYLNWSSPLGANLIGKKVGDSVIICLPGDLYEIIKLIYPKPLR
jgi:transcription elongation GreA/GreB family factor